MPPEDLADMYTEMCGKMCQSAVNLNEALQLARSAVSKEDLICITGSFYLIGEAKMRFESHLPANSRKGMAATIV
jgi:dihydrofolate synthase/folylpolyglutamate synthase